MRASLRFLALLPLATAWSPASAQQADIVGSWRGKSLCADKAHFPACNDEDVIYDVARKGTSRDTVTLRADKIVNGKRDFMAEFDFVRAPDGSWVTGFHNERVDIRIVLRVKDGQMTGVMTDEKSGHKVRDISLERSP